MAPQSWRDGEGVGTCPLGPPEGGSVKWLGCGQTLEGQLSQRRSCQPVTDFGSCGCADDDHRLDGANTD